MRADRRSAGARGGVGPGRARAIAGLREPGRTAVGARRRAAPRDGSSLRAGRRPLAAGPAVADRERAAGFGRRRGGALLLPLAAARHRVDQPDEPISSRDERQLRAAGLALRGGDCRSDRDRARTGAGLRGDPRGARRHYPVRAGKTDGVAPLSPVRCQKPVRHVPGGCGPHAAAHHRPVGRRLPVVINQTAEQRIFGAGTAVGRRLWADHDGRSYVVVGVVPDVRPSLRTADPLATAFVPIPVARFHSASIQGTTGRIPDFPEQCSV